VAGKIQQMYSLLPLCSWCGLC